MSKLDEILMEAVEAANKFGLRNGEFIEAKQQIKALILEQFKEIEEYDEVLYRKLVMKVEQL